MFAKLFLSLVAVSLNIFPISHSNRVAAVTAYPLTRMRAHSATGPIGLTPAQVKAAYHVSGGGSGTIAIVDAYDDPNAKADLNKFAGTYGLPACINANPCFTKHKMATTIPSDPNWALEESLDIEWSHAIAPKAKIMLVEAKSSGGADLLSAVDYARKQPGVVAVSMSWGAGEFDGESGYDASFTSTSGVTFFASSGDDGNGVSWPAVSSNVIGVGGTTLKMSGTKMLSETAWGGSGGGVSAYEVQPYYQAGLDANSTGMRGVPDVSYNADPNTGYSVYDSTPSAGSTGWFQVGGTSAGAPQWAALRSISGKPLNPANIYSDASVNWTAHFRDIKLGSNGICGADCTAGPGYDYLTGLGSPVSTGF